MKRMSGKEEKKEREKKINIILMNGKKNILFAFSI